MGEIKVLGVWLALALVVLSSTLLVRPVVHHCLDLVANVVGLVGLDVVALPMGFLVVLVGNCIQRSYHLALASNQITLTCLVSLHLREIFFT